LVSVAVLQARTNSSRLPAKALLPIRGFPMAVLAAKRAANTGRQVIVATSTELSDDGLAAALEEHEVPCFRGSLDNTLDRIVSALAGYGDETIVFRLTADNLLPDGRLLDELEAEFLQHDLDYLCCNGEPTGLPYGLSVEVTRLSHLREAARRAVDVYDQEHVTPYVIRKFGRKYFERYSSLGKGQFRCTVDCLDDYHVMQWVFSTVREPLREPWQTLVSNLEKAPYQPRGDRPVPKLVFGAAQLGSTYGIANNTGQPGWKMARDLLKTAIVNGVTYIDTARAYGDSETVIGHSLRKGWKGRARIITKLSLMADCPSDAIPSVVHAFVDASIFQSCASLGVRKIDVLMLHRSAHLFEWGGAVWHRLLAHQACGLIGDLGVSVQGPDELSVALEYPDIRYIQMPFNLLDWRWADVIPKLLAARATRGVTVHVRSALLQGLLPSRDAALWRQANVDSSEPVISWLEQQVLRCRRKNVADLCLGYANAQAWVDGVAIGMENMTQLHDNIEIFSRLALTGEQAANIDITRPRLSEAALNPALWGNKR
jgi:spore coat polysaccharide biosynthesis protein SpsF (cytidylyltransferase family)/aryl-alcohol dehydrogenase-like predicted oxidoreductase